LRYIAPVLTVCILFTSCIRTDLFEKNVAIPGHAWAQSFRPRIGFNITDTASSYHIFVVLRHTDAYRYNNIWVRLKSNAPGDSIETVQQFDLPLATQNRWTGTGMDDLYEHRILLYRRPVRFSRPGAYSVTLEQVMRDDPLQHILNVGLRLEKVKDP